MSALLYSFFFFFYNEHASLKCFHNLAYSLQTCQKDIQGDTEQSQTPQYGAAQQFRDTHCRTHDLWKECLKVSYTLQEVFCNYRIFTEDISTSYMLY